MIAVLEVSSFVFIKNPGEEFRMTILEIAECLVLVGVMLKMLLKKLQPGSVFLDQLTPCLDADLYIATSLKQSAAGVRPSVDVGSNHVSVPISN